MILRVGLMAAVLNFLPASGTTASEPGRLARSLAIIGDRMVRENDLAALRGVVLRDLEDALARSKGHEDEGGHRDALMIFALSRGSTSELARLIDGTALDEQHRAAFEALVSGDARAVDLLRALLPSASPRTRHLVHFAIARLSTDAEDAARHFRLAEVHGTGTLVAEAALRRRLAAGQHDGLAAELHAAESYLKCCAYSMFAREAVDAITRTLSREDVDVERTNRLLTMLDGQRRLALATDVARLMLLQGRTESVRTLLSNVSAGGMRTTLYRAVAIAEPVERRRALLPISPSGLSQEDRRLRAAALAVLDSILATPIEATPAETPDSVEIEAAVEALRAADAALVEAR